MNVKLESLDCPNCGAPLDVKAGQELVICLYCESTIRIDWPKEDSQKATPKTEVSSETIKQVKELILSGKRDEAVEMYSKNGGVSKEEASKAVRVLYNSITSKIILDRPLSAFGIFLTIFFIILLAVSFYYGVSGSQASAIIRIIAWLLFAFSVFNLLAFSRTIFTTFKYLPGKWADAKILKLARIGQNNKIAIFRFLLEVQPAQGEKFQAQVNAPVRITSIDGLNEGNVIRVKYLPNDKNSVIASVQHKKI